MTPYIKKKEVKKVLSPNGKYKTTNSPTSEKIEKLEIEIIDNQNCVSSLDQFLEPYELNKKE